MIPTAFSKFHKLLKEKPFYLGSYNLNKKLKVFVLKIHPYFIEDFYFWLQGKYSKMYKDKKLSLIQNDDYLIQLTSKSPSIFKHYQDEVKATFGIIPTYKQEMEMAIPPIKGNEVLNCKKNCDKFLFEFAIVNTVKQKIIKPVYG